MQQYTAADDSVFQKESPLLTLAYLILFPCHRHRHRHQKSRGVPTTTRPNYGISSCPAPLALEGAAGTTDKASTLGLTLNRAHLPEVWFQVREALPGRGLEVHEVRPDGSERGDAVQAALEANETRAARMWDDP